MLGNKGKRTVKGGLQAAEKNVRETASPVLPVLPCWMMKRRKRGVLMNLGWEMSRASVRRQVGLKRSRSWTVTKRSAAPAERKKLWKLLTNFVLFKGKKSACHCHCLLWYFKWSRPVLRLVWFQILEYLFGFCSEGFWLCSGKWMFYTTFSKRMSEVKCQLLRKKLQFSDGLWYFL